MNIMQKLYNKIHLNAVLALYSFLINYILQMLFSCIITSSLSCVQDSIVNEAGKNLVMYLKQTNLENCLHTSTENPKEDFNDTVFQHLVNELKSYNHSKNI